MGALRSCMGWLKERGGIHGDLPTFPLPRVAEYRPGIITVQAQVLAAIAAPARGVFLCMATMGLRPGEARALDASNVRLEVRTLVVDRAMQGPRAGDPIGPTKTRQYRELPLSGAMLGWLEHHLPARGDAPLFTNPRTGGRWSHWGLNEVWQNACRRAGVKARLYEGTKHTFATDAKARGIEDRALRDYLGHRDARSTEHYGKLARSTCATWCGAARAMSSGLLHFPVTPGRGPWAGRVVCSVCAAADQSEKPFKITGLWRSQRESNPCLGLERATS